ncbi:MAG: hypothetical protein L3J13_10355 [Devosiaceae bacterium]|nr:hypothetical protein [Devosiaceae bacterium]
MLRVTGICLAALMMAGSAQATTIGLICDGNVQLIVAPSVEKAEQCAAALTGNCTEGFRIDSGYFALASSADGLANGTAAGAADEAGAAQTAISSCEAQGNGDCSVTSSGNDDGNTSLSCG